MKNLKMTISAHNVQDVVSKFISWQVQFFHIVQLAITVKQWKARQIIFRTIQHTQSTTSPNTLSSCFQRTKNHD